MNTKKINISNKTVYFLIPVLMFFLFLNSGYSQKIQQKSEESVSDYKVINSTESYIELELYPKYSSDVDFSMGINNDSKYGSPDIKLRTFPVFFPGSSKNRVEIVDMKYEDIQGIEILPVPTYKKTEDKKGFEPVYTRDENIYNENSLYPREAAEVINVGALRNKYFGYLNLYPVQYNPVTNSIRKYSYIRVRVVFADAPVFLNRQLSGEEIKFFVNSAINYQVSSKWSTREFNSQKDFNIKNSVLASGDFYKMEVKETGMYRLDKNYLQGAGINTGNIDPRTIKIYGNNGNELPFGNLMPAPVDLVENKIYVSGEDDGQFNDNDFIVFYGKNTDDWRYETDRKTYHHVINHYSRVNYYWITFGGINGQRMQVQNSPNVSGLSPEPYFRDRLFDEPEVNNLGSTGLLWVSQRISVNESFTFNRELKGYVDGSNLNFRYRFGNGSTFPEWWRLEDLNSGFLLTQYVFPSFGDFSHINLAYIDNNQYGVNYALTPGKRNVNFKASLRSADGNSANVAGYTDYYEIHYDRFFSSDNNVLRFNSPDVNTTVEYQINNFSTPDIKIYDVTKHEDVNMISPLSYSNGMVRFQSNIITGSPKEYYTIGGINYKTPTSISVRVPNQNLKGELAAGTSFVIIAPKEFIPAANRLKAHREKIGTNNYISTSVVDVEKIYNEFSSGLQDPVAMRNFLKYGFNNWGERPVYVLFFGDGSYDYKNIYNSYNNSLKNWILPIEKNSESSDEVNSYCSDDFLVEFDQNDPAPIGDSQPDMSAGRLPANSPDEANFVVDKIISYENPLNFDKWRNAGTYVADDGWTTQYTNGGEGSLHTDQCENVAENYSPKFLKKSKIYIASYPSEITPQGRRKPEANIDIIKNWNEGRLIINYTGHGSTDLWAHEHIFERQVSIPLLNNKDKYPFLTIASCDLARWDDPFNLSAAEQLVVLKDKGSIGVVAAVRPVYSTPNATFNNALYQYLFTGDSNGVRLRVGKAFFLVKQTLHYENDIKFTLLCDPTLRLGVPQHRTKVDSINNVPGDSLFEMKSLQKVKISGSILRTDSSFWSDFSGTLDLQVYDVDKNISFIDFQSPFNYKIQGGTIYTGKANVSNGRWFVEFVVPRDISYNPGRGKIITYFRNSSTDGVGFTDNFIMNGIDTTAAADSTGPVINLYMGSRNFVTGDLVNQNPKLIADFSDDNGINFTGTIGHKIEAIINENENTKIDLTPFYISTTNYQNGTVEYQMQDLPNGKYKLEVKAWDTYNNFNSSIIEFDVRNSSSLALENVYNYPNPMQDITNFIFEHNLDEPLTATINIFTVSGRLIRELNKTNIRDKFVSLQWDGTDSDGDAIANGTYIYKVLIKSEDGNYSKSTTGKLAKLK